MRKTTCKIVPGKKRDLRSDNNYKHSFLHWFPRNLPVKYPFLHFGSVVPFMTLGSQDIWHDLTLRISLKEFT